MAEQIKIAELSIDNKKLLSELEATKKSLDELNSTQKELKKAGDTNSKTFIENEAKLKNLRKEYSSQIKVLQATTGVNEKYNKELNKEIKSVDDAKTNNAELVKIRNQVNASTEEGAEAIDAINKKLDENNKLIKDNTSKLEKQKQNVGNYPNAFNKAKTAVISFGSALKALGIGLVIAAVAKLTEAFGRNQKIVDGVNKVFTVVGAVFDKVVGTIVDTVQEVSKANGGFQSMTKVIKGLLKLALTPLQLAFYGIKLGIQEAQLLWEQSVFGDGDTKTIADLTLGILETKNQIVELGEAAYNAGKDIVNNVGGAFGEISGAISEVSDNLAKVDFKKVASDASALADAKRNIEGLIIAQEGVVQQYERQSELLRQTRDDENKTFEERQAASNALKENLIQQGDEEKKLIGIKLSAAQAELAANRDNIELQNEVARLKNEALAVDNRIESQKSEQLTSDRALNAEKLAVEEEYLNQRRELKNQIALAEEEDQVERDILAAEKAAEDQILALENIQLNEDQKTELIKLIEQDRDLQINDIKAKAREENLEDEKKTEQARIALRTQSLDAIIGLAGTETAVGKAALIAKQTLALREAAIELGLFQTKASTKIAEGAGDVASGTLKSAAAAPFPANIPLIAGFLGLAVGLFATLKSAFKKKPKMPTFADGGILQGSSHLNGGIQTPFGELEGGEAVINKKSTAMYAPLLSQINQAGGGKKFAQGGVLGTPNIPKQSLDYDLLAVKVAEANQSLPAPRVAVDEISTVSNRVSVIEQQATF